MNENVKSSRADDGGRMRDPSLKRSIYFIGSSIMLVLALIVPQRAFSADVSDDPIRGMMTPVEISAMDRTFASWDAGAAVEKPFRDEDLLAVYKEFSESVSDMTSPEDKVLPGDIQQIESIAKKFNNILSGMSLESRRKYGRLIGMMREVLYIDMQYASISADSRNIREAERLFRIHQEGVRAVDKAYLRYVVGIEDAGGETISGFEEKGYGTARLPDGSVYEGGFKNGLFDGRGILTRKNGYRYEGEFKHGFPDGEGVETLPDGTIYRGEFKDGRWHGRGTILWTDGNSYEGVFEEGELER